MRVCPDRASRRSSRALVFLLIFVFLAAPTRLLGQTPSNPNPSGSAFSNAADIFRLERVPVAGGAELVTIRARLDGLESSDDDKWIPLVTVLRDTLGDLNPENDRLRYVWPLTYTRPTLGQRIAGAIPFFYTHIGDKRTASKVPPPVLDLAAADHAVWNKIFWTALQSLLLDTYGLPLKAASRSYRENAADYRKSHIIRALSVLALYQAVAGQATFSDTELAEIQARLRLTDKTFGGLVGDLNLERYHEQQQTLARDERGHNWELLRQRAEAESLVFEPLQMPDGSMTHALLWTTKADLQANQGRRFDSRFLNIACPWSDQRLLAWNGYSEKRFVDSENRVVSAETPGARELEMIPLALYGLDNPRIPMLLVDFRDGLNPKKRELSRRALQDATRNVLSLSGYGDLPYFLGRTVFDFITGRRGIDINQPSRLRTYSQLKLLLALNQSLDPELREQLGSSLERVSLNPLENDLQAEAKLAVDQYAALLAYAQRPDGLPRKLDRDRRTEMVDLEHGRTERIIFRLGNLLSFGKYTHREPVAADTISRLDVARRMAYHTRFLREVARSSPQIDVTQNLDEVRHSLEFLAAHATAANNRSATAAAEIFLRTQDDATRRSCLEGLSRMTTPRARSEMLRLSQHKDLDQSGRALVISYLQTPRQPGEPIAASGEKTNGTRVDQ
jgi:hypothetical protein